MRGKSKSSNVSWPTLEAGKIILVAPLNWGIGHATRCVPIIQQYLNEGHQVLLASNGRAKAFLQQRFPELTFLPDPPDYDIEYPEKGSWTFSIIKQVPKILKRIGAEHRWLKKMIDEYQISQVVSDNRYGLYAPNVHSVIITHQTAPVVPKWGRRLVWSNMKRWLERFDECQICDEQPIEHSIGKSLSHKNLPGNARFIGVLSRFSLIDTIPDTRYHTVAVVSGPEPTRTQFEMELIERLKQIDKPTLIIQGKTETSERKEYGQLTVVSHLPDQEFAAVLKGAKLVISRSGYSSLMDYRTLGIKHIELIPTPGQTEQTYLASIQ
ncbi:MAG: glycosyltransferase [Flavobacteriales bacterium]